MPLDVQRSAASRSSALLIEEEVEAVLVSNVDPDAIPDDRMKLLFVCAHPAIDPAMRAPLMLQTVLGLEAEAIARAFLVPAPAMARRLVRVKRKIKVAVIPFALPARSDMAERLESVLEAIYGASSIGWDRATEAPTLDTGEDLADEARFLADLLVHLLPDEGEVLGLAAFVSLAAASRAARVSADGRYVPLDSQGAAAGLVALDQIDTPVREAYQPAWATRAYLLTLVGRHADAVEALDHAIAGTPGPRVRADLERRRAVLMSALTAQGPAPGRRR